MKFNFKYMVAALLASSAMMASAQSVQELTIVNTGSKGGGFFLESNSFSQDLERTGKYKVNFINPGNACIAAAAVNKTQGPVLFPWESGIEAVGRSNNNPACTFLPLEASKIVRIHYDVFQVCSASASMNQEKLLTRGSSYKIGHTTPPSMFISAVAGMNKSFGTAHSPILYVNGSSSSIVALTNGEIDYAFIESKLARQYVKSGGNCFAQMSTQSDNPKLVPLAKLDPANKSLQLGYYVTFILLNADTATFAKIKNDLQAAQLDPSSFTYKVWDTSGMKFDWSVPKDFDKEFEYTVRNFMPSK